MKTYRIIDILHTGHHGPAGVRKVGGKYDERRGQIFQFDAKEQKKGDTAIFWRLSLEPNTPRLPFLFTTAYEGMEHKGDNKWAIITLNSQYIVEEIE